MARVLVLAKDRSFAAPCSRVNEVWNKIEIIEGQEPTNPCQELVNFVIQDDKGKIEGTLPSGTTKRFTTCTYAHICTVLRRENKAALHDAQDFTPVYAIWQGEMNELYGEFAEDNEDEHE